MQVIIFQPNTSATQSAPKRSDIWLMQFRSSGLDRSGLQNSTNINKQVTVSFNSLNDAKAYATKHNLEYEVIPQRMHRVVKKLLK
jgi:hypothetical protein